LQWVKATVRASPSERRTTFYCGLWSAKRGYRRSSPSAPDREVGVF